jgi:5'-nucleotidase/UDP-sugar diphosphatase
MSRFLRRAAAAVSAALLLCAGAMTAEASVQADGVHLAILYTNGLLGHIEPGGREGKDLGMAELTGLCWAERAREADTLLLDTGDALSGSPLIETGKGASMVSLMNLAGFDAMNVGEKDFAYGREQLLSLAKATNFPLLSANLLYRKTGRLPFPPCKVFNLSGVKVGVFGLMSGSDEAAGMEELQAFSADVSARGAVELLKSQGAEVIVCLLSLGSTAQAETAEKLAGEVPGIDLMLVGQQAEALPEGKRAGQTLICRAGRYGQSLGRAELVVHEGKLVQQQTALIDRAQAGAAAALDSASAQAVKSIERGYQKAYGKKAWKKLQREEFPPEKHQKKSKRTAVKK